MDRAKKMAERNLRKFENVPPAKEVLQIAQLRQQKAKIIVTTNWSCVTSPSLVVRWLKQKYSEFSPSARFTHLFKRGLWDGRYSMIADDGGFGTGLLYDVLTSLTANGIEYELEDHRDKLRNHFTRQNHNWKWTGKDLRDVQKETLRAMHSNYSGIIHLATGTGKTIAAIRYIFEMKIAPVLYAVPRSDLMYQTKKEIEESVSGITVGLLGDGHKDVENKDIVIVTHAMLVSLRKQLNDDNYREWTGQYGILIIDECHKAGSDGAPSATWMACMDIPAPYRFGFSATPFEKEDSLQGMYVRACLGDIIMHRSVQQVVEDGHLVPSTVYFVRPTYNKEFLFDSMWNDEEGDDERKYNEEHDKWIVDNESRNLYLTAITQEMLNDGHKVLVVAQRIPHNDFLFGEITANTNYATFQFHGGIKNRKEVMNTYRNTKGACCMVASSIANEGIDVRDITCVIVAHGGKSFYQVVQRIGRGLRIDPDSDKKELIVIDVDDSELSPWFKSHVAKRRKQYRDVIGATIYDV